MFLVILGKCLNRNIKPFISMSSCNFLCYDFDVKSTITKLISFIPRRCVTRETVQKKNAQLVNRLFQQQVIVTHLSHDFARFPIKLDHSLIAYLSCHGPSCRNSFVRIICSKFCAPFGMIILVRIPISFGKWEIDSKSNPLICCAIRNMFSS